MRVAVRQLVLVGLLRRFRRPVPLRELIAELRRAGVLTDADHEAARKTVQRDLRRLRHDGVVVSWQAGAGGYELEPSARATAVVPLEPEDAALLVECARRLTRAAPGLGPRVEAALEQHEAPALAAQGPLAVHVPAADVDADALLRVTDAVWQRQRVRFAYTTLDGRAGTRLVEPWGVFHRGGAWYLLGRDVDREDVRTFRLAALGALSVAPRADVFPAPTGPRSDVTAWARLRPWDWNVHEPVEAVLRCEGVAPLVAREVNGGVDGDRVRLTVTQLDALVDVVWRWAPRVLPEAPPALVQRVRDLAVRLAARHRGAS